MKRETSGFYGAVAFACVWAAILCGHLCAVIPSTLGLACGVVAVLCAVGFLYAITRCMTTSVRVREA